MAKKKKTEYDKRITIKDVAREVGVTPTTISMVIHNNKDIPEKTRKKVLAAIKKLNYIPNLAARSLVSGKSDTIALVSSFFYPHFTQLMLDGIEHQLRRLPYHVTHYSTYGKKQKKINAYQQILYGKQADCLISLNVTPAPEILEFVKKRNFPMIMVEKNLTGIHSVFCDNKEGGYMATDYLLKSGRKRLHYVGSKDWGTRVQVHRQSGYEKALTGNNKPFEKTKMHIVDHNTFEAGKVWFREIMKKKIKIDSIFCAAGDSVAIGIMHEARKQGLGIPGDLTIIGFDDLELSSYVYPTLSTVRQPGLTMGEAAVGIALELLAGKDPGRIRKIKYQPDLILRETT